MGWLALPVLLVAVAAWLVAVASAVRMLRHRSPGRSLFVALTDGMSFFTGRGFTAGAEQHRRRFLRAAAVFFVTLFAAIALAIILDGKPAT